MFKKLALATVALSVLSSAAMAEPTVTGEQMAKTRSDFATPESDKVLEKLGKALGNKSMKCDDFSGSILFCESDKKDLTVEAVPTDTTKAKAKELCKSDSDDTVEYQPELKAGGSKFKLLYCTTDKTETGDTDEGYLDKSTYTCDNAEGELKELIAEGPAGRMGVRLLYAKNVKEISRNKTELKCKATIVTNSFSMNGTVRFYEEDGHSLVTWKKN
jgi:hypothetical protein